MSVLEGCLVPLLLGWHKNPLPVSFGGTKMGDLQWMAEFTLLPGRPQAASTSTPLKGTKTNAI